MAKNRNFTLRWVRGEFGGGECNVINGWNEKWNQSINWRHAQLSRMRALVSRLSDWYPFVIAFNTVLNK